VAALAINHQEESLSPSVWLFLEKCKNAQFGSGTCICVTLMAKYYKKKRKRKMEKSKKPWR
jgi:hypothetical protein